MNFWAPENLREVTAGRWLRRPADNVPIDGLSTDSRTVKPGQVFLALHGDKFDGHDHLPAAAERGSPLLIIDREPASGTPLPPGASAILLVPDTLAALSHLAIAFRKLIRGKVIAITGSVGKTTTKQIIHAVLAAKHKGSASPKSFNNNIGVPLTILAADPGDAYLVVEVGTNAPGEIASLAAIVQPDVAVITTIGNAHLEGLGGIDGVLREKTSLLNFVAPGGLAVLNADAHGLTGYRQVVANTVTYGAGEQWDLRLTDYHADGVTATFQVNNHFTYKIPLLGRHNALNALAAIAIARYMHLSDEQIAQGLASAAAPHMRLNLRKLGPTDKPLVLIDDSYNANPDSMASSLAVLADYPVAADGRRIAILGDMLELGERSPELHRGLGELITAMPIDEAVFIGKLSQFAAAALAKNWPQTRVHAIAAWSADTAQHVAALLRPGDVTLIKASRGMGLERLIPVIETRMDPAAQPAARAGSAIAS